MSNAEKIASNLEVHGLKFAAKKAKQAGIPFDTFYFTIFGKYPQVKARKSK